MEAVQEQVKERPLPQLIGNKVKLEESVHNVWMVNGGVPYDTNKDDLINPEFWAHTAAKLRRGDEIKVLPDDDSFYAHLLVVACDRTWARVAMLSYVELREVHTQASAAMRGDYLVKLRGPKKWSVLRKSDNKVLIEGLHQEVDAQNWLDLYLENPNAVSA